jgi:hypothetical protein
MKQSKHDQQLSLLINNAIKHNLKEIKAISLDNRFYGTTNLICEPDMLVFASNELYVIEYKCRDTPHNRRRAKQQLETAKDYILNEMGIYVPIHKLYCYEGSRLEEV